MFIISYWSDLSILVWWWGCSGELLGVWLHVYLYRFNSNHKANPNPNPNPNPSLIRYDTVWLYVYS